METSQWEGRPGWSPSALPGEPGWALGKKGLGSHIRVPRLKTGGAGLWCFPGPQLTSRPERPSKANLKGLKEGPKEEGCRGRAPHWGGAGEGVGGRGLSGEKRQEQREGQELRAARPRARGAGKAAGHLRVGVALGGLEPLLQTSPAAPALRARPEGATPDPLTQVGRRGEVVREGAAGGPLWAAGLPCGGQAQATQPLPSARPRDLPRGRPELASARGEGTSARGEGASRALPSLTHPDSRPSRRASWTCRCGRCGSPPTSAHSPPGTGARPEPAPPARAGPPGCGTARGRTVRASV